MPKFKKIRTIIHVTFHFVDILPDLKLASNKKPLSGPNNYQSTSIIHCDINASSKTTSISKHLQLQLGEKK